MSIDIAVTVPLEKRLLVEAYRAGGELCPSPGVGEGVVRVLLGFDLIDPAGAGHYRLTPLGAYIAGQLSARMFIAELDVGLVQPCASITPVRAHPGAP